MPEKSELETQRLELEIKERKWWWVKVFFTPSAFLFGIVWSVYTFNETWKLQIEQQRQETITNLKREFTSENNAVRIGATLALAEYPKEAIPVLIASLKEEDTAFVAAVKTSLRQIGKDAIIPLAVELRRLQDEIGAIFAPLIEKITPELKGLSLPESGMTRGVVFRDFSMNTLFNEDLEDIRKKLASIQPKMDKEINAIITQLKDKRSSKPQLKIAHENTVEVLAELLHQHHIPRCQLRGLDLSGAFLLGANLSDAVLISTNLSGANLISTDLSNAVLVETNLSGANLIRANLSGANLSYADLPSANFGEVNLSGVLGFNDIDDFSNTNLKGVKGLSKKDLEYAKSKGAITD